MKKKGRKKAKTKGKGVLGEKPIPMQLTLQGKTFFLTYKGISDSGQKITKQDLAKYLVNQNPRELISPEKYLICEQMYDSGEPHFHVILVYSKRKKLHTSTFYDYKTIHPNIQTMRNMKAALQYVYKEDPYPYTNMDIEQQKRVATARNTKALYQFLEQQMKKDPLNFDVYKYCIQHNLTKQIYHANYTKAVSLIKSVQPHYSYKQLHAQKPGIKVIDKALIEQRLTPSEFKRFYSWKGYQTIVDFLNTMTIQKGHRPQKSMNLLITGLPSTGKSALIWQRYPEPGRTSLANHVPIYPMGMKDWFPEYKSDVYTAIYWNEAKLTSYSYDVILQLLDGSPVMLPAKGGGHKKVDNPLIIMTSNLTLDQLIKQKFNYNKAYQEMAQRNLSVRVTNVIIPKGYNLFLLQKLLVPL